MDDKTKKIRQVQRASLQKYNDYKSVFGTEEGKRVLFDMMANHHFITPTLSVKNNAIEAAFNEGQRNVILRVLTYMKLDIRQIEKLMLEGEQNVSKARANLTI